MSTTIYLQTGSSVTFDATPQISVDHPLEATEHPVELGVDVTDHVQRRALQISLTGVVSRVRVGAQQATVLGNIVAGVETFFRNAEGKSVSVSAGQLGTYTSLVVTSWRQVFTTVRGAVFDVQLRELVVGTAGSVIIPPLAPTTPQAQGSAASPQDVGEQAAAGIGADAASEATSNEDIDVMQSLLYGFTFGS